MAEVLFADRDGIEWTVSWRPAETAAMVVGGRVTSFPAGLAFRCSAVWFRAPIPYRVDPRAVPRARLQAMVDRALEQ